MNTDLIKAAKDHVNDIGPKGLTSHTGSDGSSPYERIALHGQASGCLGENLSFSL
jgi:uncharacterized protein YkwD